MVLEELYSADWLKQKPLFAFLLGISYSIVGMGAAIFLFPNDPALVAVAITSMLMLPLLRNLVSALEESSFISLFHQNKDAFKIYILLFLGSFLTFAFFSAALPSLAANFLFKNQLQLYFGGIAGDAFSTGLFFDLFNNNLKVLIFSFIFSLILGGGSIFIIMWNASLWGTIFGMLAKIAAGTTGQNPWLLFGLIFLIVFPHMILEVSSYMLAAISGSMFSLDVLKEKFLSENFKSILRNSLYVLIFAVIVLIIAVLVEVYVLQTFTIYRTIVKAAFS